jgi:hypothetical protein
MEERMAITRERFNQGMTYDEFKVSMTRNRDRVEALEARVEIKPEDLAAFKNLPEPMDVLVIGADWCYDVITNLPVLVRVAKESGKLNLRVFERDQSPDVMAEYMNGPYTSIPVFVFFDRSFNEIGHWIERPKAVTDTRDERRREIFAKNPEFGAPDAPVDQLPEETRAKLSQAVGAMREDSIPWANQQVISDLRAIVEGRTKRAGNLATAASTV